MFRFVSLAHTVFNAGLGEPWNANAAEKRYFRPVAEWVRLLGDVGLLGEIGLADIAADLVRVEQRSGGGMPGAIRLIVGGIRPERIVVDEIAA